MLKHKQNEKFIDLKELSKLLLLNDTRSALKWCQDKNIDIQTIGKKQVVHNFIVNMELDKKLLSDLQRKHPLIWEDLYKCYLENDHLSYIKFLDSNTDQIVVHERFSSAAIPETDYAKAFANS